MGRKTKIDWCDATWNPVTGCLHGCEYCYARGIANRFGTHIGSKDNLHVLDTPIRCSDTWCFMQMAGISAGRKQPYPYDFDPTFHRYKLEEPQHWKKPRTIFVCSMADLFGDWVPDEWIKAVFDACVAAPQHRYLFLTKNPTRYMDLIKNHRTPFEELYLPYGDNFWFGSTATTKKAPFWYSNFPLRKTFISIEPIMEPFTNLGHGTDCFADWVIVGAETGNRKGKVIPKKSWIISIAEACERTRTPLFMKESLREIMGEDFRQELPWED